MRCASTFYRTPACTAATNGERFVGLNTREPSAPQGAEGIFSSGHRPTRHLSDDLAAPSVAAQTQEPARCSPVARLLRSIPARARNTKPSSRSLRGGSIFRSCAVLLLASTLTGCARLTCRSGSMLNADGKFTPIEICNQQVCRDVTNGRLVRCP